MILKVNKVSVAYGKRIVLKDVDLVFEEGTLTGIVGPNGSGKSTLLKTIATLLKPIAGTVYLDFSELFKMSRREISKKISVVLTERPEADLIKVKDLVALGRYPYTNILGKLTERDLKIVEECLELVKAKHLEDRYFTELSDGEKQKVLIARALAQEPKVLILDEPTTFLDIRHRMEIMSILRNIAKSRNIIVIASLHELDIAARFCDQIIIMNDGKIVKKGSPEEVLDEDTLSHVYSLESVGVWSSGPMFEIKVRPEDRIFIVAGCGTGIKVYRKLARNNIGFYTGILYRFDIDYITAKIMNAGIISIEDNQDKEIAMKKAMKLIERSRVIIDTKFPRIKIYEHNIKILEYAREIGKEIITIDNLDISEIVKNLSA